MQLFLTPPDFMIAENLFSLSLFFFATNNMFKHTYLEKEEKNELSISNNYKYTIIDE
jgi:hypothetical protein